MQSLLTALTMLSMEQRVALLLVTSAERRPHAVVLLSEDENESTLGLMMKASFVTMTTEGQAAAFITMDTQQRVTARIGMSNELVVLAPEDENESALGAMMKASPVTMTTEGQAAAFITMVMQQRVTARIGMSNEQCMLVVLASMLLLFCFPNAKPKGSGSSNDKGGA
jgi:hypothetical protein